MKRGKKGIKQNYNKFIKIFCLIIIVILVLALLLFLKENLGNSQSSLKGSLNSIWSLFQLSTVNSSLRASFNYPPTTAPSYPTSTNNPPYCKNARWLFKNGQDIDCGVSGLDRYDCSCSNNYSRCVRFYTFRGCSSGACFSSTNSMGQDKFCANGCDSRQDSPDYGHCKNDCNPSCGQCKKCFTWDTQSYCIAGPDGVNCTTSYGYPGVCRSGSCQPSSCRASSSNPDGTCRKCNEQTGRFEPDLSKNGASCTSSNPLIVNGFCSNGVCIERNCQNLGFSTCGNNTASTCCASSETCCGANSRSPLCCKNTETCRNKINLNGYTEIWVLIQEIRNSHHDSNYILTPGDWVYIFNKIKTNPDFFDNFCEPTRSNCEADGSHQLCSGTFGSACCPLTGPGSRCIIYRFYNPPNAVPGIPAWLQSILSPEFTIGMCGNEDSCPTGTFECTGNSHSTSNITGGKLCCRTGSEVCGTQRIYGGPSGFWPLTPNPWIIVPVCKPLIYCPAGYSDCVNNWLGMKICCKNGEEVCINIPNNYLRCAPLSTTTPTSASSQLQFLKL